MNKLLYFTGSPLYRLENKVVLTVLYLWCISSSNHFSSILERVSLPAESSSYIGGSKNFHQMLPELEEMESLMILLPHYPPLFFPRMLLSLEPLLLKSVNLSINNQSTNDDKGTLGGH